MYRGVLISGCWNRGVLLYTEVSSFQGVGIEEFHCTQRCPLFRVLCSTVYSCDRGVFIWEVRIEGLHKTIFNWREHVMINDLRAGCGQLSWNLCLYE